MDEGSTPESDIFHRRRAEEEGEIAESVALRGGHLSGPQALLPDVGQKPWFHGCRHRDPGSGNRLEYGRLHSVRRHLPTSDALTGSLPASGCLFGIP